MPTQQQAKILKPLLEKKHLDQTYLLSVSEHNHLRHRVNFCLAADQSIAKILGVTLKQYMKKDLQKQSVCPWERLLH